MQFNAKSRRRWFGALCLLAALVMLVAGETTPGERLDGLAFVGYWLACFLFATLAMFTAMLDARAVRREARQAQRTLLESTLEDIERGRQPRPRREAQRPSRPSDSGSSSPG
jgi:membrane protein implicated in regulation of membrane protease activity